eukprot:1145233-Pleurochrysis_carterae.AAC.3
MLAFPIGPRQTPESPCLLTMHFRMLLDLFCCLCTCDLSTRGNVGQHTERVAAASEKRLKDAGFEGSGVGRQVWRRTGPRESI